MPTPSTDPLPEQLRALDQEASLRKEVERAFHVFYVRPSERAADATIDALVAWKATVPNEREQPRG